MHLLYPSAPGVLTLRPRRPFALSVARLGRARRNRRSHHRHGYLILMAIRQSQFTTSIVARSTETGETSETDKTVFLLSAIPSLLSVATDGRSFAMCALHPERRPSDPGTIQSLYFRMMLPGEAIVLWPGATTMSYITFDALSRAFAQRYWRSPSHLDLECNTSVGGLFPFRFVRISSRR